MRTSVVTACVLTLVNTALALYECPKHDPFLTPMCCYTNVSFKCYEMSRPPENLEMFEAICLVGQRAALCCDISKELVAGNCKNPSRDWEDGENDGN